MLEQQELIAVADVFGVASSPGPAAQQPEWCLQVVREAYAKTLGW
ncbi:hypothetical protein ACSHWB_18055 [Lentzea sp. HUAS TT2]